MNEATKNKAVSWTVYILLAVGFVGWFVHSAITDRFDANDVESMVGSYNYTRYIGIRSDKINLEGLGDGLQNHNNWLSKNEEEFRGLVGDERYDELVRQARSDLEKVQQIQELIRKFYTELAERVGEEVGEEEKEQSSLIFTEEGVFEFSSEAEVQRFNNDQFLKYLTQTYGSDADKFNLVWSDDGTVLIGAYRTPN